MIASSIAGIPYYRFESFPQNGQVSHAVFTRVGGKSTGPFESLNLSVAVNDDESTVMTNRECAYGTHGRSTHSLVHAHLIHGAGVAEVNQFDNGRYVGPVDALITDRPGCGLTMNYADCSAVVLYDPAQNAIGLGHSGWQGAVKDLPGAMVRAMTRAFNTFPDQLVAGIGPSIGPCCYEVGQRVISAVEEAFESTGEALLGTKIQKRSPASYAYFDLPAANELRLRQAGVKQIEVADLCTACRTDLFFSHRAESGVTGRFGALLILE